MGIDALIGALVADGTAEAARIRAAAQADADALVREATLRGEALVTAARDAAEGELRTHVAESVFQARRESRREVLRARDAALERVREEAARTLAAAHGDATLPAVLPPLVRNAMTYLPDAPAVARCHPALAPMVRDVARETARRDFVVREDAGVAPGVVLEDAAGAVRVEETLPVRLDRLWPTLRMQLAHALAGSESP